MKTRLPEIRHNRAGFLALAKLAEDTASCFLDEIEIDMSGVGWFDADMCAPLGAVLTRLTSELNSVTLRDMQPDVERILSKNGFLSHYGGYVVPDRWATTISYLRFDAKDDRYFADYIENELMHRSEIPTMSPGLSKKFLENIFEIFSNAVLHAESKQGIFSCGQYYPKRHALNFSVADLGMGMRRNIKERMGLDLTARDAIAWATQARNTTKRGSVPGGLGLRLLVEFIDLNGGNIQIVSDAGYWRRSDRQTTSTALPHDFPGTVVTLEINTADTRSYVLTSEINLSDIF